MIQLLGRSAIAVVVLTLVFGVAYPVLFTGFSQLVFSDKADGSMIERNGKIVGSKLAAQAFTKPQYFHPRPSATSPEYNAAATTFANLGPTNPDLAKAVRRRAQAILKLERPYNPGLTDRRHPGRRRHDLGVRDRSADLPGQRAPPGRPRREGAGSLAGACLAADRPEHRRPLARHLR